MTAVEYVEAADLRAAPLRVATAPLFSLLMAARDAAGAGRSDTPEPWCRAIRTHLTPRDYEMLAPLATSEPTLVPNAILPFPEPPGQTLKDGLERIVAGESDLIRDIDICRAQGPTGDWRAPCREPKRWMRGLVVALARAWKGFAPIWQQGQDQLAVDIERLTAAAERGAQLEVLGDLVPYARLGDGRWELTTFGSEDVRLRPPPEGLLLVPLVAGPRASMADHDATTLRHVGYALRPPWNGGRLPRRYEASLEALLGIPRARILRELDRPSTNGRLAETLQSVPSAATHHVSALESAGLVLRDRSGGGMLIRRTPRGDALLALYECS